eukprot:c4543_g1_i1 orf=89-391(-)
MLFFENCTNNMQQLSRHVFKKQHLACQQIDLNLCSHKILITKQSHTSLSTRQPWVSIPLQFHVMHREVYTSNSAAVIKAMRGDFNHSQFSSWILQHVTGP